jgi:hypothetical protein
MKKFVIGLVSFALCSAALALTERERELQYSLTTLSRVVTNVAWVSEVDTGWRTNIAKPFVGGVANVTLGLDYGPARYWAGMEWVDRNEYPLFSSYGSIKQIDSGMNYMDFPMYISSWRQVAVAVNVPGVTSDSDIWVNGYHAWWNGTSWTAYVSTPWNVTELTIVWGGHGQWRVGVTPTFDYGRTIALNATGMDSSVTTPAQAFGLSYLGDLSNPTSQVVSVTELKYDETLGVGVLVCSNSLYQKYGSFKVMVTLQNYDPNLGNSVQFFSAYIDVKNGEFLVPLMNRNGGGLGIPEFTYVRFIYADPSDGGTVKQQWDYYLSWGGVEARAEPFL